MSSLLDLSPESSFNNIDDDHNWNDEKDKSSSWNMLVLAMRGDGDD